MDILPERNRGQEPFSSKTKERNRGQEPFSSKTKGLRNRGQEPFSSKTKGLEPLRKKRSAISGQPSATRAPHN